MADCKGAELATVEEQQPSDFGRSGDARPTAARRVGRGVGWLTVALIATVLVLRAAPPLGVGRIDFFTQLLAAATPMLIVPVVVAVLAALVSRTRDLGVATALVVAVFAVTVAPVDAVVGCGPEPETAAADGAIRIYSANVWSGRGRAADIGAAIVAEDVDVVVLQEARWVFQQELLAVPGMDRFGYSVSEELDQSDTDVILSRWPLGNAAREQLGGRTVISADIEHPDGVFRVHNVHTTAPMRPGNMSRWQAQLDAIGEIPNETPTILAGDFNATEDHQPFRSLLSNGWSDVHDDRGCGPDATWPVNRRFVPRPLLRLDHVLVSDHFTTRSLRLGSPHGSDHMPLITEMDWTP